ncbi:MAG TPA: DUF2254 domain-containing protein [Longimicrobiales bacterium]|nr:DUF2254 domain-containing protein [Longimicrobiales bacterium]
MKLRSLWDRVRQGLWFLPSVIVLASAGLAAAMIEIDALLYRRDLEPTSIIFGGSAEGARGVLSAIAGGLITVTGVVFSITIVALQLASTQFTPRVLQNFMGDRGNQIVLGVFLGTFTYTLLILRTIRSAAEGYLPFVPGASVTVAVVLTLISMGLLIYYLQNVTGWIEASSIIDRVTRDTLIQIRKRFPVAFMEDHEYADPSAPRKPARMGATTIADAAFEPDDAPAWLLALKSGYLERIHHDDLFSLAVERDLVIRLEHGVGDFVVEATPLLSIWPRDALDAPLLEELRGTLDIGHRRTITQDAELGIIQLSDIAVKAMSPSINDPTTAMMAIDRLGQIIAELGGRFPRDRTRTDDAGRVRVVSPAFDFAAAADVAFSQIRRYAAADAAVMSHLALTLSIIGTRVGPQDRQALLGLLGEIEDGARARMDYEADRRRVADAVAQAKRRLARLGGSAAIILALLCGAATPALAQDTIPALGRDTAALAQAATQSADTVAADQVSLTDTVIGSARHVVLALASDTWATLAAPFGLDDPGAGAVGLRVSTPF